LRTSQQDTVKLELIAQVLYLKNDVEAAVDFTVFLNQIIDEQRRCTLRSENEGNAISVM